MDHPNYPFVISLIRGYYCGLNDPWKHDFIESEEERQDDDDWQRESILRDIQKYLEVDRDDAEKLLDRFD